MFFANVFILAWFWHCVACKHDLFLEWGRKLASERLLSHRVSVESRYSFRAPNPNDCQTTTVNCGFTCVLP